VVQWCRTHSSSYLLLPVAKRIAAECASTFIVKM